MNPFLLGFCLPLALAILVGFAIYSPGGFVALMIVYAIAGWWKYRRWVDSLPPSTALPPLPEPDPDGFVRRVMRPANGDVAPQPHATKPRPYVGPPMKLPKGGLLRAGE